MDTGKSALGLDGNLASALGYPIGIIAIISLIMEKENKFVKFHALQSLLFSVAAVVLLIVFAIIWTILSLIIGMASSSAGVLVGGLGWLIYLVVLLVYLGGLIFAAVKAYGGDEYKLPMVGAYADKFANK